MVLEFIVSDVSCFYLGTGYVSGKISSICKTTEVVYYDKCKKINLTVTRPPVDSTKLNDVIRIVDVYDKKMKGEFIFRGYNIKRYDYNDIINEAFELLYELPPLRTRHTLNFEGIRIYRHVPGKNITTSLPL
ncbi:hypothetical protein WA158_002835 [Blastocystis sp. Blastoise]